MILFSYSGHILLSSTKYVYLFQRYEARFLLPPSLLTPLASDTVDWGFVKLCVSESIQYVSLYACLLLSFCFVTIS